MSGTARLRIAVLNRNFSSKSGGAESYSIALVEQLAARHDIHVFAQQINHQWPGVTYHTLPSPVTRPRWINQIWYATVTWWATRRGFDIVHSHENTWHGQVQTVHVLPVKYTLFNGLSLWPLSIRWLKVLTSPRLMAYLWLEHLRFSGRNKAHIVVTSGSLASQMLRVYPRVSGRLTVVSPGVSMAVGIAASARQLAARQRLNLPESGRGVLFVGNDYRKKGLATLIKALVQLPESTWLAVVGSTAQLPEFTAQAQIAGVHGRIFFLGALDEISDAYVASDCLAHPTLEDTFGMVVLEALAHGLPVVVSSEQYCGISSLLTDENNALILTEPRDSNELARALLRLSEDVALSQALQKGSVALARQHQWVDVGLQQESIYFLALAATN
jgi:glycosyltransferase involved in cell wall biosynthesis